MSSLAHIRELVGVAAVAGMNFCSLLRICLRACCSRPNRSDTSELDRLMLSGADSPVAKCGGYQDEMADQDPFGEAGNPCTICSSETRYNTHFAFPCHHAACELCWQTWLRERQTCMICGNQVKSIHRFSETLLVTAHCSKSGEDQGYLDGIMSVRTICDDGSMHSLNADLEAALAQLVKELVTVKARLRDVSCTFSPHSCFHSVHVSTSRFREIFVSPANCHVSREFLRDAHASDVVRRLRLASHPRRRRDHRHHLKPVRRRCACGCRTCGPTWTGRGCGAWAPTRARPSPPSRAPPSRTRSAHAIVLRRSTVLRRLRIDVMQ
jgi:hypothetical protein